MTIVYLLLVAVNINLQDTNILYTSLNTFYDIRFKAHVADLVVYLTSKNIIMIAY